MTQTSTSRPPAVPGGPPAPPAPSGTTVVPAAHRDAAPGPVARLTALLQGSPGRLRIAAAVSALACIAFGLLGAQALQARANALEDARRDAAQLVRVQEAASDLARADAAVTNGFLVSGGETPALIATYDEAIASASRRLVDAAAAAPQDRASLAQANALLTDYSRQVAHARDFNRTGAPLASGYLVIASQNLLREQIDPLLDATVQSTEGRVDDAFGRADTATIGLTVGAMLVVLVLLGASLWLARRTRRMLNVGLVTALVAVVAGVGAATVVMSSSGATAEQVRSKDYPQVQGLAAARNAAYRAKGLESLTLVKQGGGGVYEEAWQEERDAITAGLTEAQQAGTTGAQAVRDESLTAWTATHDAIRALDDGGDWPTAVQAATVAEPGAGSDDLSSNADFQALVSGIDDLLDRETPGVTDTLGEHWNSLQLVGWGVLGLGILAALAAVAGFAQRLGEYR